MVRCIAIDFDNTLAHMDDPGYSGLFAIFTSRGVSLEAVREIYGKVTALVGFTICALIDAIQVAGLLKCDDTIAIEREFDYWLLGHLTCYDDSTSQVNAWLAHGIPVIIVTSGEESYQRKKIEISQIACTDIIVVPPTRKKSHVIRELFGKYGGPIIMIDDKASELDSVREDELSESDVRTIWIKRFDGRHTNQHAQYPHKEVTTLADPIIIALIDL
ncbi:MAG: HAD family hydrolase [Candidatus Spechtbacteria bacterium]|nr:HAD family hydrolase [Candidatus Spechtbacteria bacterium]